MIARLYGQEMIPLINKRHPGAVRVLAGQTTLDAGGNPISKDKKEISISGF